MTARITDKREVAKGTLEVTFELAQPIAFKPGQFFQITLLNPPFNDDRGPRRIFSIINPPSRPGIITIVTRLRDTAFKRSLAALPIGAEVEIGRVAGSLILPDSPSRPLVLIAGGIGIAPFMSIIRHVQDQHLDYHLTLLYANRNKDSAAYLDELQHVPGLRLIATMDGDPAWPGEKRMIDAQFIKDYIPAPHASSYMIAGPPGMSDALLNALLGAGVDKSHVKVEKFAGY